MKQSPFSEVRGGTQTVAPYPEGSEDGQRVIGCQSLQEGGPAAVGHRQQLVLLLAQHVHAQLQHVQDLHTNTLDFSDNGKLPTTSHPYGRQITTETSDNAADSVPQSVSEKEVTCPTAPSCGSLRKTMQGLSSQQD